MFEYVPRISGGQKPIIEEKDEFKVTIPYLMAGPAADNTGKTRGKTREKTREKILSLIKDNHGISTKELASIIGITEKGIEWQLSKLKLQGILKRQGSDKGGHWVIKK